jgi:hypothetical protein
MSVEQWRTVPGFPRIECSRYQIKRDGRITNAKQVLRQSRTKIFRLAWGGVWDRSLLARKSANPRRGQRHGQHRLTNAAVRYIRQSDETLSALAERYKVWPQTIWLVRTRQTWRHVS